MNWMLLPLKRYAEFSGRSRRMEYWMFALLNVIVAFAVLAVIMGGGFSMAQLAAAETAPAALGPLVWLGFGVLGLWWLAIIVPSIAVTVRRLHDRDMSGWWYLGFFIAGFIPFINFISGIAFFVLMVLPGTPGPNRFGPDPKDPASADVFA